VLQGERFTGPATAVGVGDASPSHADDSEERETPPPLDPRDAELERTAGAGAYPVDPVATSAPSARSTEREALPSGSPPATPGSTFETPKPSLGSRTRYGWAALALLLVIGGAIGAVVALSSGGSGQAAGGATFAAAARPVPTNRVTGTGSATIAIRGDTATVTLDTNGLLNGSPHAMHIHAGGQGICPPASAAHLHNGNLSISTTDGIKFYGRPQASLTLRGDMSVNSITDFSRYPTTGNITYKRTFKVAPGVADAIRASNAVIVVHGIDYNHNGLYDDVLDRSELNRTLPGEATAPALCGPLSATARAAVGSSSRSTGVVYAAALHSYDPSPNQGSSTFWLLCHLAGPPAPSTPSRSAGPGEGAPA
jgi:hypothetical protein